MAKNLLYCCVLYNKDYFKLLTLLLKSMRMFSQHTAFDILIITQSEFLPIVDELEQTLNFKLFTFCIPCTTIFQAACARLSIFNYPDIHNYDKLLYLDTDIIIKQDITPIFDLTIDNLLYGIESGNIGSPSFGIQFFNFATISKSVTGINSGTLFFKKCEPVQSLFSRICNHIDLHTKAGHPIPYCMDQPFINFHAIKDKLYDNQLLNPYISLFEDNDIVTNYKTSSICHFSFPIGNFGHKYNRMSKFFLKILTEQKPILNTMNINSKKYSWRDGYITFFEKDKLITTWSQYGKYTLIQPLIIQAVWNNHYHILKMNENCTEYISIRTHPMDFDFIIGSILPSK